MTYVTNITNITNNCNYILSSIFIMQLSKPQERRDMSHYQQTLIIPMPRQRFPEPDTFRRPGRRERADCRNNTNRELNSILAFFD